MPKTSTSQLALTPHVEQVHGTKASGQLDEAVGAAPLGESIGRVEDNVRVTPPALASR